MHTPSWSRARSTAGASSPATPVQRPSHLPAMSSSASLYSQPTSNTLGAHSKLVNVTRVAIEGVAKHDQDGATIRMYLKLALPVENAIAHTSIPLFPEGGIKIVKSQVHPLDQHSSPYQFSPNVSPMLSRAAHALDLPKRLHESYLSVLEDASLDSPEYGSTSSPFTRTSSIKSAKQRPVDTEPLDERFTGKITVSNYQVTFVPPKELPSRSRLQQQFEDTEPSSRNAAATPGKIRRQSVIERNSCQFMAVIEVWIPYTFRPPRSPYVLHIPVPRCLQNTIRLRISGAPAVSSSLASLSSVEDDGGGGAWDVMCEPPVTRNPSRLARTTSSNSFADDESSDSSFHSNATEGCRVEGTFISTEMIRVRWSKPLKPMALKGGQETRRRAGVQRSSGEMSCTVLGKAPAPGPSSDAEGILMKVEYRGTCSGVWFSGVATQVALDLSLESKGSEVHWPSPVGSGWSVTGGVGFTGHHTGGSSSTSRPSSMDFGVPGGLPSPLEMPTRPRYDSTSSSSSLLRAPLPVPNVADYSFEGSTSSLTGSGTSAHASVFSSTSATPEALPIDHKPDSPITLHLNLDALNSSQSSTPGTFDFSITGTVVVVARNSTTRARQKQALRPPDAVTDVSLLPRFTLLAAEQESTSFTLRNEVPEEAMTVEVYNPSGDVLNAQTRKTVLQPGKTTTCGDGGARIALKVISEPASTRAQQAPEALATTPVASDVPALKVTSPAPSGPKLIPSVFARVSPLMSKYRSSLAECAVRVEITVHDVDGSGWLRFSLGQGVVSKMDMVVASMGGRAVPLERLEKSLLLVDAERSHPDTRAFIGSDHGVLALDYLLPSKGPAATMVIQLPVFEHVVGKCEVSVRSVPGIEVDACNLAHTQHARESTEFLHFMAPPNFSPRLTISKSPSNKLVSKLTPVLRLLKVLNGIAPYLLHLITISLLFLLGSEMQLVKLSAQSCPASQSSHGWHPPPIASTYTVTNTVTSIQYRSTEAPTPSSSSLSQTTPLPSTHHDTTHEHELHETPTIDIRKTYIPDARETPARPPTPQVNEDAQLALMYHLPWSAREQVRQIAETTAAHVLQGMQVMLQVARKLYHYPLDPPP